MATPIGGISPFLLDCWNSPRVPPPTSPELTYTTRHYVLPFLYTSAAAMRTFFADSTVGGLAPGSRARTPAPIKKSIVRRISSFRSNFEDEGSQLGHPSSKSLPGWALASRHAATCLELRSSPLPSSDDTKNESRDPILVSSARAASPGTQDPTLSFSLTQDPTLSFSLCVEGIAASEFIVDMSTIHMRPGTTQSCPKISTRYE